MKKTISLFLVHKNEVILAVRAKGQTYPGVMQATAHGEVESGETIEQALERELEEETSLTMNMVKDLEYMGKSIVGARKVEECHYYKASIDEQYHKMMEPCFEIERFELIEKGACSYGKHDLLSRRKSAGIFRKAESLRTSGQTEDPLPHPSRGCMRN